MNDHDIGNFKIRLDDENPDEVLSAEGKEAEPAPKPPSNSRMFLLFFLLFIFFAVGLGAVYLDIRKRVAANIDAGTSVISNVSKEVSASLVAIASRQKEFEGMMNESVSKLKNSTADINKRLKNMEALAKSIEATKANKNEVATLVSEFETKISSVQSSVETLSAQTKTLMDNVNLELTSVRNDISTRKKEIETIKKDMSSLHAEKLDKKTYENAVQNESDRYSETLGKLEKDIDFIRYKIKIVEERLPAPSKGSEPPSTLIPGEKGKGISEQTIK